MKMEKIKTGGRLKGTPNKITKESRAILSEIVSNEIDNLPELLEQLEPRERAFVIIKLMPYVMPKMNDESIQDYQPLIISIPDCI